jgi:hypothetical protein
MKFDTAKEIVRQRTSDLFAQIGMVCSANETKGINVGWDDVNCTITNNLISLTVEMNVLNGELSVSEWSDRVIIPGEPISGFRFPPKALRKTCFVPDSPPGCNFGWRENGRPAHPLLSVAELAERCVRQFIALEQRYENGQVKREWRGNARPSRRAVHP